MGWNASVVVLLDALDDIEQDPEFGRKLVRAIRKQLREPQYVTSGRSANAAVVVLQHHADELSVVAVGGNMGRVVCRGLPWSLLREADNNKFREQIVREVAQRLSQRKRAPEPQKGGER